MDQAVEDGIGEGRIPDPVVPFTEGDLGDDEGGEEVVAVLQDLEQILALVLGQGKKEKVVHNDQILPGQVLEEGQEFSGTAGDRQRLEEAGEAEEKNPISHPAGLVPQGFAQIALSDPGRPRDEDVLAIGDPLAGEQRLHQGPGEISVGPEVDVFRRGVLAEAGGLEAPFGPFVFLGRDLPVDQEPQTIFKGEFGQKSGGALLVVQPLDEAGQLQGLKFVLERIL